MNKSRIEWTEMTWNPVTGCTKVSVGCKNCYAEHIARRLAGRGGYPEAPYHFDVTLHPKRLTQPSLLQKPATVFVCSMGDLFHEDVPFEFIKQVFMEIADCPWHTFQILTKRPERMLQFINSEFMFASIWRKTRAGTWPPDNAWLGTSCENQATADERIPVLLQTPAKIRFISCEPLLGPIDLTYFACESCRGEGLISIPAFPGSATVAMRICSRCEGKGTELDWIIVGGESGLGARPMHPAWVQTIRDQCLITQVPFFFKQWGEWIPLGQETPFQISKKTPSCWLSKDGSPGLPDYNTMLQVPALLFKVGKKNAGNILDGRAWKEYP